MKTKRTHVLLPRDLVREIDAIVGPRGRSAFLVETAREGTRLEGRRSSRTRARCGSLGVRLAAGKLAGTMKRTWAKRGRTVALADTVVASLAIERGCTLFTDNRKDFPMDEFPMYPLP